MRQVFCMLHLQYTTRSPIVNSPRPGRQAALHPGFPRNPSPARYGPIASARLQVARADPEAGPRLPYSRGPSLLHPDRHGRDFAWYPPPRHVLPRCRQGRGRLNTCEFRQAPAPTAHAAAPSDVQRTHRPNRPEHAQSHRAALLPWQTHTLRAPNLIAPFSRQQCPHFSRLTRML